MKLRCYFGWHKWLYYGPFDTRRHCVLCMKREDYHFDLTFDPMGRWL